MEAAFLWQIKLAARLHDPAEKALVLLRDPAGHENGTSKALLRLLGLETDVQPKAASAGLSQLLTTDGLPTDWYRWVQRADWWAAAADRPQWPLQEITVAGGCTMAIAPWAQVRWSERPILIHPLTGEEINLGSLRETEIQDLKERSFEHFSRIREAVGAERADPRQLLLAYWRFGPELQETEDNGTLGALWPLLPADTRVPDHSIWDHLDLTSAFAGAFAADPDGEAALLSLSIGPVQSFIAQARSTSDLWAGSHLLSRLSWEAMRPLCETLGPDAILFPRLRGIPQVDLWLRDQMELPESLFADCDWKRGSTDANPLFSAALPNRFVAVVPASQVELLAQQCTQAVRAWLQEQGEEVVSRLLDAAGFDAETENLPYAQMREQLEGFPEVHWAGVPFRLIRMRDSARQRDLDTLPLSEAMAPFFGVQAGAPCGFLDTPAWKVLSQEIDWQDGTRFFAPNPGVLYPAVFDLAERVLAAAKSARPFSSHCAEGWRCSLTGEAEWLCTDREHLYSSYRQQTDTLWARVARKKPSWAKPGEHLAALPAIKRLWPTLFLEEVGKALSDRDDGSQKSIGRFVVSTHTMALAHQLDDWLEKGGVTAPGFAEQVQDVGPVALPRRLIRKYAGQQALEDAKRIPALLEQAEENDGDRIRAERLIRDTLAHALGGEVRIEKYYGLLMMDGDRMGAILSGDSETGTAISYERSFHPALRNGFRQHADRQSAIAAYGAQERAISPNRHLSISGALNDFSQVVVREVVEGEYLGRVLYAGGDDVLAMLPVADLLPAMERLRHAYSGTAPEDVQLDWGVLRNDPQRLHCKNGFAWLRGRLMRMMGEKATASTGAVVAHHQAPLSAVMRALRAAEHRAKEYGRDAFSLTIVKRSGGALLLTAKWGEPIRLLRDFRRFLAADGTSRRAVYNSLEWLRDLPPLQEANGELLEDLLRYQLARQSGRAGETQSLAKRLAALAIAEEQERGKGRYWLENFLTVAEFFSRETRTGDDA